ncbi:MAG: HAD family hydrolase [Planctomycetes bacterium]|nr:HAD family hydrolase [Planctomycetota bacterium]
MFIRAILFDLDETLYDERMSVKIALEKASAHAAARFNSINRAQLERIYLEEANKRWEAFEEEIRMKGRGAQQDPLRVREMCFAQALAACGAPPSFSPELTRFYGDQRRGCHLLFQDSKETLEQLRSQAFIALVSNGGSAYQREKLKATGIEHLFHVVIISEESGYSKPQKGIFEKALRECCVPAHEAVMVGDNLEKDILGAKIVGLRGVLICRNGDRPKFGAGQPRPEAILHSLGELQKTLTTFAGKKS